MDRSWYFRFSVVIAAAVGAWLFLWPSIDSAGWMTAPSWVKDSFAGRISPGLDIRGGLRLMYEVEIDEYIRDRRDRHSEQMVRELGSLLSIFDEDDMDSVSREQLASVGERATVQRVGRRGVRVRFEQGSDKAKFTTEWLSERFPDLRLVGSDGNQVDLEMREDRIAELTQTAVEQAKLTISNRVDGLGLREASVLSRDTDIIVEIPGADQAQFERIREIIATTARLEFKIVDEEGTAALLSSVDRTTLPEGVSILAESAPNGENRPPVQSYFVQARGRKCDENDTECTPIRATVDQYIASLTIPDDHQLVLQELSREELPNLGQNEEAFRSYYVYRTTNVTGEDVEDAFVSFASDQGNQPVVTLNFNASGASKFEDMSGRNIQRRMAIVLDDEASSAPLINERIGANCRITLGGGDYNQLYNEANDLVVVLRAGSLPAPLRPANEQHIGPTLGRDAVQQGLTGALVGIGLVLLFMMFYYEVAGVVAAVMVSLNVLLLLAIMAGLEATLTLPGIAAIALTVGMAVDANVLIIERIREELRLGKSPRAAVEQGFDRAFSSIFDGQLTTFIAGIVLAQYGTGPIKGFAVNLMIGIVTSLFTGVFASKVAMDWLVRGAHVKQLRVG